MFHQGWFSIVDAAPVEVVARLRWWDKAATEGHGDYTVGVLMSYVNQVYYVVDVVRGQWSFSERDRIIRATAQRDREVYGHVVTWGPQDPGQAGKVEAAAFVKLLGGFEVYTQPETGDKATRAAPLAAQCQAGNLYVLRASWTEGYINELCEFPSGKHDDQVDASSGAFSKLGGVLDLDSWSREYEKMGIANKPIVPAPDLPYNVQQESRPLGNEPFKLT